MEEISRRDRFPQIAAHNFQWSIIQGVEEASGRGMDLLGSIPASDYPNFPKIFFGYRRWKHRDGAEDVLMPFVNLILLKHLSRFFLSLLFISAWLRRHRGCVVRSVLVYAMHTPHVMAALIATRIFGGKRILIIPDLPNYSDVGMKRGFLRRAAKRIDIRLLPWLAGRFDGLVVVSRYIVADLCIEGIPHIVVDNAVTARQLGNDGAEGIRNANAEESEKIVMYAGGLFEEYGVGLLLDAFARIPEENYRLWICGRGTMESLVKERSLRDPRIVYWGFLPNQEVMDKERRSTILVNARPADGAFTRYSCPIKLLEFMLSARPTITTALPGIPEEYKDYLYLLKEETPEGLADLIREVGSRPAKELSDFGQRAREFVRREKSYRVQGKRIYDLLVRISGGMHPSHAGVQGN